MCTPMTNGLGWAAQSNFSENLVSSGLPRWFCNMLGGSEIKYNNNNNLVLALLLLHVLLMRLEAMIKGTCLKQVEVEAN